MLHAVFFHAEKRRRVGIFQRTLAYPLALLLLLALTGTAVVIVGLNTLQLLVGIKALPLASAPAILGEAQQGKVGVCSITICGYGRIILPDKVVYPLREEGSLVPVCDNLDRGPF